MQGKIEVNVVDETPQQSQEEIFKELFWLGVLLEEGDVDLRTFTMVWH